MVTMAARVAPGASGSRLTAAVVAGRSVELTMAAASNSPALPGCIKSTIDSPPGRSAT